ncbi:MAG: NBR1-Ig-like domain-containing protein [Bacteroidota bacterium]
MKIPRRLLILLLLLPAVLNACGGAPASQPPSQVDMVLTEGVKTMVASYFATQTAMAPAATATSLPTLPPTAAFTPLGFPNGSPVASPTRPLLLSTPTFAYIPPVTITGTLPTALTNSGGFDCNNLAFIADVNYPPGTAVQPHENFTKTWKVANTGTCQWLYVYRLLFVSGTDFDAPSVNLGRIVEPNHWAEISINLDAPGADGTYSAYWRLSDGDGHMFGATLGVTIQVGGSGGGRETPNPTLPPR